jgi:hypothetical protein
VGRQLRERADKRALFAAIRELAQRDELSIRALAEQFGVHRRIVCQALSAPEPPVRKKQNYPVPRLGPAREVIDAMLLIDPTMPAGHVWEQLLDKHDIIISYSTVRNTSPNAGVSPPQKR